MTVKKAELQKDPSVVDKSTPFQSPATTTATAQPRESKPAATRCLAAGKSQDSRMCSWSCGRPWGHSFVKKNMGFSIFYLQYAGCVCNFFTLQCGADMICNICFFGPRRLERCPSYVQTRIDQQPLLIHNSLRP